MRQFRKGDVVEVRSAGEILETLDDDGALDGLPFMPEMLHHVGRRFTVSAAVEKICDTISATGGRRMHDVVYLEDLRCDGSGHGGCQAACRIYWKEAWLRPVNNGDNAADAPIASPEIATELDRRAHSAARTTRDLDGQQEEVWRCQATEALRATEQLKTSNVRQYWRELRSGNHRFFRFAYVCATGFVLELRSRLPGFRPLPLQGPGKQPRPTEALNLRPGDVVQVRSRKEIAATLDENGFMRGLSFDREMIPYCGGTYRVQDRVEQIIDERTGRMLKIPSDCLILEGVVCSGEISPGRWFCPRAVYPYWREAWVRPIREGGQEEHQHG